MVSHRPGRGGVKTATVHKSGTGKWSITFSCACEPERLPDWSQHVGIDVGLVTFATLSHAAELETPRFSRREEKALKRVQRKRSQRSTGTPQRKNQRKGVASVHERTTCTRQNFTHQHSRQLGDRYGGSCVEDVNTNRMLHTHCLANGIREAACSALFSQLSAKAEEAGRQFIKVNPADTAHTCSACGQRQEMPLSKRVFECPCGSARLDRDLDAS